MTNELLMILFLCALVLVCVLAVINASEKAKHVAVMAHLKTIVDNWDALRRGDFRILFAEETVKAQNERDSRLIAAVEARGHETASILTRALLEDMDRAWKRVPHIVGIEGAQQLRIMRRLLGEMFEKQFPPADPNADQYQQKSDAMAAEQLKAMLIEAARSALQGDETPEHRADQLASLIVPNLVAAMQRTVTSQIAHQIDTIIEASISKRLPTEKHFRKVVRDIVAADKSPRGTKRAKSRT